MPAAGDPSEPAPERVSDQLAGWLRTDDTTLGGPIDLFGLKSFALLVGRKEIWVPARWRGLKVGGHEANSRFVRAL